MLINFRTSSSALLMKRVDGSAVKKIGQLSSQLIGEHDLSSKLADEVNRNKSIIRQLLWQYGIFVVLYIIVFTLSCSCALNSR